MLQPFDRIERALERVDRAVATGWRWPLLLFAAALLLKTVFVLQSADSLYVRVPIMDSRYYDEVAQDIARGHVVRNEAFFMGPLYPYFLAVVYSTAGRDFTLVRLLQAAGGALTVVFIFLMGRRLFRPSAALIGAVLLAWYGAMTFYETELLMEWLGVLLNSAVLLVLVRSREKPSLRPYLGAGALMGLSGLARANILVFAVFATAWIAWVERGPRRAATFAAGVFVALLPALVHNYAVSRVLVPITTNAGVNFYVGNARGATGTFVPIRGVDVIDDATTRDFVERMTVEPMNPAQVSSFWFNRALDDVRADPYRALRLLARKVALFFNGYEIPQIESFDIQRREFSWLRVLFVPLWPVMAVGLLGMLLAARDWRRHGLLLGYVLTYAAVVVAFFVTGRYRSQVAPALCLFAGYALTAGSVWARSPRALAATAVVLVALVNVSNPHLFRVDETLARFHDQVRRGRRLSEVGGYAPALREIDKAIAIYPEQSDGDVHRAIVHKENRNDFKAIEDYNRALTIDPAQPSVHYDLAQAFRRVNLLEQAVREYQQALDYNPSMLQARNNMGVTLRELGRYDEAIAAFRAVVVASPRHVKAYNNLGATYAETGRLDDAVAIFEETNRRFPDYANGYRNLAMALISQKRPREALAAMRKYAELNPSDSDATEAIRKLEIAVQADTSSTR
jgi:tetratricopeptide (TPR) repeat protein